MVVALAFSRDFYKVFTDFSGLFPDRWFLTSMSFVIIALHAFEAYRAFVIARKLPAGSMKLRRKNAMDWWLQTFILGWASLSVLLAIRKKHREQTTQED